ncbi:MAG: formylglycine-generating enzyme family protein [Candidatus Electrothrix sp. AR5]|nr:formylglycine-generating enzyme family protein [Candidatus Electrothrix sp. AR5]
MTAINTANHPLASGNPPPWASGWGQDSYGVWVEFTVKGEGKPVTQRMRWIPPGRFLMGSPKDEPGRWDDEGPQHQVTISQGFWLFDTPVTQALWLAVTGENPSKFQSDDLPSSGRPVEQVSWNDCQNFLKEINRKLPGLELALPAEAQWEYACRAGTSTALYSGPIEIIGDGNAPALHPLAWYGGNSGEGFELDNGQEISYLDNRQFISNPCGTHPVGQKKANDWGLYDMLGNVWEWTADSWHENYQDAPADGEVWEDKQLEKSDELRRVIRGGSWSLEARSCRSAYRGRRGPDYRVGDLGFRCARVQV